MVYLLVILACELIHIATESLCLHMNVIMLSTASDTSQIFFYFLPPNLFFLGQQPCFNASICLSNNVTIYCIIVLYSHFMLSHSPRHYLKIVKTLSEKFLPERK